MVKYVCKYPLTEPKYFILYRCFVILLVSCVLYGIDRTFNIVFAKYSYKMKRTCFLNDLEHGLFIICIMRTIAKG